MTRTDSLKLPAGIYRLFWKAGGWDWAAVGVLHTGVRWYATVGAKAIRPTGIASQEWKVVARAEIADIGTVLQ